MLAFSHWVLGQPRAFSHVCLGLFAALQAVDGMKAVFALFGIAAVCFGVISLAICLVLPFMFLNLAMM